jgi:phosphatidylglycerophosphate synthase
MVFFGAGWRVWMVLLAIFGGSMVSYARARAEGLGLRCEIGWLQRPERFVSLGFGSIFSSIWVHLWGGDHGLLAATVTLLAVLSNSPPRNALSTPAARCRSRMPQLRGKGWRVLGISLDARRRRGAR